MSVSKPLIVLLVMTLLSGATTVVCAQDNEAAQARKRIESLLREAEELQKAGKLDRADVLRRQALELKLGTH